MPSRERLIATVQGHVQGVGYRVYVQEMADRLGIRGSAKNLKDGTVEVIGEGRVSSLDQFEVALRVGSPASTVRRVEARREPLNGHRVRSFKIDW
ncbi:MAG: acylphosphatase [Bacteroidota bacterium]